MYGADCIKSTLKTLFNVFLKYVYKYKSNKISISNIGCGIYDIIYYILHRWSILPGSEVINCIYLKPSSQITHHIIKALKKLAVEKSWGAIQIWTLYQ